MTKLKTLAFATMLAFIGVSCDNSDDSNDPPTNQDLLIKQIIHSNLVDSNLYIETYNYTDGNILTSIETSDNDTTTFYYENGLLDRIDNGYENVKVYYDANNRMSEYIVQFTDEEGEHRHTFIYNSDGTITETHYINSPTPSWVSTHTINNGQITKSILESTSSDYFHVSDYIFDTQNGIFKNIAQIETMALIGIDFTGLIKSVGNNLLENIDTEDGISTQYEAYTYTYNADGYPATAEYYFYGEFENHIEYIYE